MSSLPSIPGVTLAARLEPRVPPMVSSGIGAIDGLTGGFPQGSLVEICGPASSGRTTILLSALAAAGVRAELCALVDVGDNLDPASAAVAGVDLDRLLWLRCGRALPAVSPEKLYRRKHRDEWSGRLEQALKITDLLLQGGGFGLIALDMADVPADIARRVPLASWFRFRRAVEHTPAVLLVIEEAPNAGTCASLVLKTAAGAPQIRRTANQVSTGPLPGEILENKRPFADISASPSKRNFSACRGPRMRNYWAACQSWLRWSAPAVGRSLPVASAPALPGAEYMRDEYQYRRQRQLRRLMGVRLIAFSEAC